MVWEDVEFLGDVGSRLKHVLNTTRPVHRLSNLLSPSPSPSPRDMRRMEEYFDVEGDRREFVMARKVVPGGGGLAGPPFLDRKFKVVTKEATTTTIDTSTAISTAIATPIQLIFPSGTIGDGKEFSDEDSIFFPCYDHLPSTVSSLQPSLSPIICTFDNVDACALPTSFSTSPSSIQTHDSFISLCNDTVDDSYLQHPPTHHVDYLSHDWREEDLSASWRFNMSIRRDDKDEEKKNRARLLNASWRRWGMTRFDLDTLPAEKIHWVKDDDLTWLYGPIKISRETTATRDPRRLGSLDLNTPRDAEFEAELIQSPHFPSNLPPQAPESSILRIPTLEQVLLQRSASELALHRHLPPTSSLESSRSSLPRSNSARFNSPGNQYSPPSPSNTSSDGSPSTQPPKRVSFHTEVFQAIKVLTHTDSDERAMTQQQLRQSRNISNQKQRRHSSDPSPLIHEPIAPAPLAQPGQVLPRAGESSATGAMGAYDALTGSSFFGPTAQPGNLLPYADAPILKPLINSKTLAYQNSLKKQLGPVARAETAISDVKDRVSSAVKRNLSLGSSDEAHSQFELEEQDAEEGGCCIPKLPCGTAVNCTVMSAQLPPDMPFLTDEEYFEYEMFGLPIPKARSDIAHTSFGNVDHFDLDTSQEAEEKQAAVFNDFSIQQRYLPASSLSSYEAHFGQGAMVSEPLAMDDEEYWFMNV